jgi:hypothetical protein
MWSSDGEGRSIRSDALYPADGGWGVIIPWVILGGGSFIPWVNLSVTGNGGPRQKLFFFDPPNRFVQIPWDLS